MDHEERLKAALADRYAVEREIGSGGMATVYLAQDLKHDRKVAVKVLKPELAAILGAERFLTEIKVTANLQHPHILPLFDSGEADGLLFYVMPYVEGETLRDRLSREKQLPVDEAIRIAAEAANALDYAHRHNVIHRDIKPGNILLLDGQALVSDFGIALAVSVAGGNRVTETGLSLGTPEYMSPEQASADRELDARSDVYSLGSVLYEMLVGEPPHTGASVQAILSRVLTREVEPVSNRRPSVPKHVDVAVEIALQKMAADRFQTAGAFAGTLTGDISLPTRFLAPAEEPTPGITEQSRTSRVVRAASAALILAIGGVSGWLIAKAAAGPSPSAPVTSFTVPIPGGSNVGQSPGLALSPDGETIVFETEDGIHSRPLSGFDSRSIPGTVGSSNPFFSPDGRWVGFTQGGIIKKVPLNGGQVTEIAGIPDGWLLGADWGEDEYVAHSGIGGIRRVPAGGGGLEIITTMDLNAEHMHMWPQVLDGGRKLLFTAIGPSGQSDQAKVLIKDLETEDQEVVVERGTFGRYLPTGHVLYATVDGTILAMPFDLKEMTATGDPVAVESGVHVAAWGGGPQLAISESGTAAFIRGEVWSENILWVVDRTGQARQVADPMKVYYLKISPDGQSAALAVSRPFETDIHIIDLTTGQLEHLTFASPFEDAAVWSPDGSRIAFSSDWVGGGSQISVQEVIPGASASELFTGEHHIHLTDWSPDGRWLTFEYHVPGMQRDVYAVQVDSVENLFPIMATTSNEGGGAFSGDGRWVAYHSDGEVFVTPFPPTGGKQQVSTSGGSRPRWMPGTGELMYWKGDTVMVMNVSTEGTFSRGPPEPLFVFPPGRTYFDVSPDGQTFLIAARNPDARASEIHVVRNWFEVVKQKLGGGR